MTRPTWRVAALLFCSGACALIYQTAWQRQFRVIFGTSTYATAAVLAIFMGGLGLGSAILGKRSDKANRPLVFYGTLEIAIAISAALSPLVLVLVRWIYFACGGSVTMGPGLAAIVRLALSSLVLGIPTVLMGGTLPAAARAVESSDDSGRKRLSLLYGANTLGAVTGTVVSTFYLLEHLGNRNTLLTAAVLNVAVGIVAIFLSRVTPSEPEVLVTRAPEEAAEVPRAFVLAAAGIVGFAFLLMEIVWYRMLSPLLGGTTFMFGLILAVALAGIGLGGGCYSFWSGKGRATPGGFAITCTAEAALLIAPFALGDHLALITLLLRPLGVLGFGGHVLGWTLITLVTVFPAAFISGIQFPLLISLLGRGRSDIGRDVGLAYAWNTAGAIAGSLAGGFGLLPLLGAPGIWQLSAVLLALLGVASLIYAFRGGERAVALAATLIAVLAILGTTTPGPGAPWRHSGVGAGRAAVPSSLNGAREWMRNRQRTTVWDADGRESSIALTADVDLALVVNGKADGTARGDAGTQVMSGMLPVLFASKLEHVSVIGLGTGTTAGWLAALPSMKRVDVVELEPEVVEAAKEFRAVNLDVNRNPKVRMFLGDAREVLVTTKDHYDLIFSEPSNPYRAGIASLYTREFYRSASERLTEDGIFCQWMQTYNVDASTLRTVYATLATSFPNVETWWTTETDLLLIATKKPLSHDVNAIRARLATEPFKSAAHRAWRVESAEGVLAHFISSNKVSQELARGGTINSDDRPVIEFSFARMLGGSSIPIPSLINNARKLDGGVPFDLRGAVDWKAVAETRALSLPASSPHSALMNAFNGHDFSGARAILGGMQWKLVSSQDLAVTAFILADGGDERALPLAQSLRMWEPIEADVIEAQLRFRENKPREAAQLLGRAYVAYRRNPWPLPAIMFYSFETALAVSEDHEAAGILLEALSQPFSSGQWSEARLMTRLGVAQKLEPCGRQALAALESLEPNVPWRGSTLALRAKCYAQARMTDRARVAEEELDEFRSAEPAPLMGRNR
jgi:spermidine synthase